MSILLPIAIPLVAAVVVLALPRKSWRLPGLLALLATAATVAASLRMWGKESVMNLNWLGFGIDWSLRQYHFSNFIVLAASVFAFLVTLYSFSFLKGWERGKLFFAYLLLTVGLANGAVLSNNLVLMLFFWEGLLLTLFGFIYLGHKDSFRTAIKAFTIVGISDLCMMVGIALTVYCAHTATISQIKLPITPLTSAAFVLLMIGAIAKAGSMPFHSWIPDAAIEAPLPFMAFLPGALEKLLGIYFLARISIDMFILTGNSWLSTLLMVVGGLTIIFAVMMALVQKDYKKLLSYHAISQVGYMVLGIGTCLPLGIVGGLFHMINNALYKSCLFLTGGAVEKQAGTTDLAQLGGIGKKMPVTFACFLVTAAAISGVPPLNGFFSKELVYSAALSRGVIFYLLAAGGSFFTAASFLKLGHAVYIGKRNPAHEGVKEAPVPMLIAMITIALGCVVFGFFHALPLGKLIWPIVARGGAHEAAPENHLLVLISVIFLIGAVVNHVLSVRAVKVAHKASDLFHHAPILRGIYSLAEQHRLDPYEISLQIAERIAFLLYLFDRFIDWIYERFIVWVAFLFSRLLRRLHRGNVADYLGWSLLGMSAVVWFLVRKG